MMHTNRIPQSVRLLAAALRIVFLVSTAMLFLAAMVR